LSLPHAGTGNRFGHWTSDQDVALKLNVARIPDLQFGNRIENFSFSDIFPILYIDRSPYAILIASPQSSPDGRERLRRSQYRLSEK